MTEFEVPNPILNSPYREPEHYWYLEEGKPAELRDGRRPAGYFYRDPKEPELEENNVRGAWTELRTVNLIRSRLQEWRHQGYPGVTRITLDLLKYWQREGREHRLFFAQVEAAEAVIFLTEARPDFKQGIAIPLDVPGEEGVTSGFKAFKRYACKMATGSGKTTVMGMLAAWSILNKVNSRSDARFSDVVLIVCPTVTIRSRLQELDPRNGQASLYRTRDLVPAEQMQDLAKGRVIITNWHVFEPQTSQINGVTARVARVGIRVDTTETLLIGAKTTVARGKRYVTLDEYGRQLATGVIEVCKEVRDGQGNLKSATVISHRYVESDTAVVNRVLGVEAKGKQNIFVFNDEAHHAYRIRKPEPDEDEDEIFADKEDIEQYFREATVWVDGLDRIHKLRGINLCIDMSATPYFLARVGQETNRIFPWTVCDFGLTDAIESGLVKIPQLAVRDTTGADIPGYFNIWRWIYPQLTPAERGASRASPKPEAIVKYANHPMAMLGGLWRDTFHAWQSHVDDPRPPVFIIVSKNTRIAKVIYEWIAQNKPPTNVPAFGIQEFINDSDHLYTIRVDSRVVEESDSDESNSDENRWMRFTLDTVGWVDWLHDSQGRPLYPDGFAELAAKLRRSLDPPGKEVRCIVSVGMLTEGWDCRTVTHIIGLRPFMSQLLCEQVVGRGLRRSTYEVGEDGEKFSEEVAKIFGVPFEVIPFKADPTAAPTAKARRWHVNAVPQKQQYAITFPRVEGYQQAVRNHITVDWSSVATLVLDPTHIPPEVQMKAGIANNQGRYTLTGPGPAENVSMNPYRAGHRMQELAFELAATLTQSYVSQDSCAVPRHVLFPQILHIVEQYLHTKIRPCPPAQLLDVFVSPYYGYVIERLLEAIKPDTSQGEAPELPKCESNRQEGNTSGVDFWTARDVREVVHSHLNYVVADTAKWEQSAAYVIDTHPAVQAFVKNSGLGFAIRYLDNGEPHEYVPDFLVRLKGTGNEYVILETKGFDPKAEIKEQAAQRWCAAVNAAGKWGHWQYAMARRPEQVNVLLDQAAARQRNRLSAVSQWW